MKWLALAVFLSLCPLCLCGSSPHALDSTDERAIELALRAIKMSEHDLGFSKTNVESELILSQSRLLLQNPLLLPAYGSDARTSCSTATNLADLVDLAFAQLTSRRLESGCAEAEDSLDQEFITKLPQAVERPVRYLTAVARLARKIPLVKKGATPTRALAGFAPEALHLDQDQGELATWRQLGMNTNYLEELLDRDKNLILQDTETADLILDEVDKFDLPRLRAATMHLAHAVDYAISQLRTGNLTNEFQFETDTELGKIVVGGTGKNIYTNEAFLIIDLGGDDIYSNSAGGANGLAGRPISILIDLAGNDQFISKHSFSQGSGVFGIGILAALGSNCTFQAKHFSQGAGFFGCGILMTGEGKQTFEADTFCQGAGMFGTGILWQRGGDTSYTANKYAQGFGGVQGTGLLLDSAGNDSYAAGGKEPCPWTPGQFFSLSQGFGYGMRPYAGGGIGILCDLKGDDRYKAGVYGQGASYWYAVGLLLDAEGNDTYEAYQYCQGAGIHLSTGSLIDWSGDDTYTAHAICQGAAHDYSVGILVDRAGNDRYTGNTTAQGSAINNSFALLLDRAGDDTYTGTDAKQSQAAGHDGDKREYGSIALLLDLAGIDTYPQGQSNNAARLKPFYGAGLDTESAGGTRSVASVGDLRPRQSVALQNDDLAAQSKGRLYTTAPVDPNHPIEHLFRVATSDRPEAGKAWEELKAHAAENLPYLITRLASPNVMVRVKVEQLVDHLDTNSIPVLIAGIRTTKDDEVARLCCYYLARFNEKARAAIPAVLPLLKRDKTRTTAFYTLGHLRATEAFTPAVRALDDPKELICLRATQALGKTGNRRAIPHLIRQLDDEIYCVRYAAQDALVTFGKPASPRLRAAYDKATPRAKPHLLEALAKLGDDRALPLAREFYRNDEPIVRDAIEKSLAAALHSAHEN
ncbi:MAG: hypothetical protein PCFJNLEI_03130 [Verrucomicrobiae bacterium]|nr:hypothetical protein [Verrucomicrobiae bacterium]